MPIKTTSCVSKTSLGTKVTIFNTIHDGAYIRNKQTWVMNQVTLSQMST